MTNPDLLSRVAEEQVIADYRAAYEAANGSWPYTVSYESGWFRFRRSGFAFSVGKYRRKDMLRMTSTLRARQNEEKLG